MYIYICIYIYIRIYIYVRVFIDVNCRYQKGFQSTMLFVGVKVGIE